LLELPQEYWRPKTLFEIANGVGTPLYLDVATKNHTFGHYARILVDMDLSKRNFDEILVEREGFSFYVDIAYEWLPAYCHNCATIGHVIGQCKWLHNNQKASREVAKKQKTVNKTSEKLQDKEKGKTSSSNDAQPIVMQSTGCSKIVVDEDPLLSDMIRSKEMGATIHVKDVINLVEKTVTRTLPVQFVQVGESFSYD